MKRISKAENRKTKQANVSSFLQAQPLVLKHKKIFICFNAICARVANLWKVGNAFP